MNLFPGWMSESFINCWAGDCKGCPTWPVALGCGWGMIDGTFGPGGTSICMPVLREVSSDCSSNNAISLTTSSQTIVCTFTGVIATTPKRNEIEN